MLTTKRTAGGPRSWIRGGVRGARDWIAAKYHGIPLQMYSLEQLTEGIRKYGGIKAPIPVGIRKAVYEVHKKASESLLELIKAYLAEENDRKTGGTIYRKAGAFDWLRRAVRGITKEEQYLERLRDVLDRAKPATSLIEYKIRELIPPIIERIDKRLAAIRKERTEKKKPKSPPKTTKTPPKTTTMAAADDVLPRRRFGIFNWMTSPAKPKPSEKPKSPAKVQKAPSKPKSPPKPKPKSPSPAKIQKAPSKVRSPKKKKTKSKSKPKTPSKPKKAASVSAKTKCENLKMERLENGEDSGSEDCEDL
jgi:hypothetical protein